MHPGAVCPTLEAGGKYEKDTLLLLPALPASAPVPVEIVTAGEEGVVFFTSAWTDWSNEFEVKYTDFPFPAHIVVTNNDSEGVTA